MENFRLTVFRAVAAALSFRKAAEALHLSQPAVSQQIHALEEEVGVRLFDRAFAGNGSGIALTEAGRVLLRHATAAALTLQQAQRELAALNHAVAGELRLGASTTVAQYLLPRILGAFLRQYPHVRLSLISGNTERIVAEVVEERLALGIVEGPTLRRELKRERMAEDEMVLILAPDHALAVAKKPILPSALRSLPLLFRERGSGSRRVVERALKQAGLALRSLRIAMELDSTEAIVSGVEAGLGAGFVSRIAVGRALRLGTVRIVPVEGLDIRRDFSLIRLHGAELEGAPAAFRAFALADRADLAIGWALHLSQTQFGLWAALAIHDTSSVVGAGAKYGPTALAVGTTVKLARALWIVPLAIGTAMLKRSKTRIQYPWFILYFCVAAVLASYVPHSLPQSVEVFAALNKLGHAALTVVLFLIGTGITRTTLKEVGLRPLIQGVTLWIVVASLSLWAIHAGWIAL